MTNTLTLVRPLVAFDVETTGLDVQTDRIIEIACIKLHVDGRRECYSKRLNPQIPIGAAATAVHGIRDEDVAHEPCFADHAAELLEFLRDCDLTGFNVEQFDLPLLTREFERTKIPFPTWPLSVIDSWRIYMRNEPRDLKAAFRFYCGKDIEHAHSARSDAEAAADILLAQVGHYGTLPQDVQGLGAYCREKRPDWVDPDGKIVWRDNQAVLSFGRHKNRSLEQLAAQEPDYLHWIASANFSAQVVSIAEAALSGVFPQRQNKVPGTELPAG